MAEIVNINPDKLIQAASTVADHLAAAAIPPAGALPPGLAPSPADLAAAGVDGLFKQKIAIAETGLADTGIRVNRVTTHASGSLQALDADNSGRIVAVDDWRR